MLIVDDHPGFCALARAVLERDGYTVVGQSEDGRSAIAAARALRPDAALVDVNLPDIDGFTVAQLLAREDSPPRVVLTSSEEWDGFGRLARDAGALGFVAKTELAARRLDTLWKLPSEEG